MTKSEKKEYDRKYRLENIEAIRKYRSENKEAIKERDRKYYSENTLTDSALIYGLRDKRDLDKAILKVGQTSNPSARFRAHKYNGRRGYERVGSRKYLIELYEYIRDVIGVENLEMVPLEKVPTDQRLLRENYWIDKLEPRSNINRNKIKKETLLDKMVLG